MLKRSHRRTLMDLLIEALLIVFSVLIALAANRWRDQHVARQRLEVAEQNIHVELQNNRAILRNMIPYHEAEVQRIGLFLAQPDLAEKVRGQAFNDLPDQLMPRGYWNPTVSPQNLSDAAWRSAPSDGSASNMPAHLLNQLTAYYALQNSGVQHTLQFMTQRYLSPQMFDPGSAILMLRTSRGWFHELASEEKELLAYTNDSLKALPRLAKH